MSVDIFINYRRGDVPGDARGLRDALVAAFGPDRVFMDVEDMTPGRRFDRELASAIRECRVLIAVIGPRWIELLADRINSRERDFVREEIAFALQRGIAVIPVCVGRLGQLVALPVPEQLPADIATLVLHQKLDVTLEKFRRDVADLTAAVGLVLDEQPRAPQAPATKRSHWWWIAVGCVVVLALVGVAAFMLAQPAVESGNGPSIGLPLEIAPAKSRFVSGSDALSFRLMVRQPLWLYCLSDDADSGAALGRGLLLYPGSAPDGYGRVHLSARQLAPRTYVFPSAEFGLDAKLLPASEPGCTRLRCYAGRERLPDNVERFWLQRTIFERGANQLSAEALGEIVERLRGAGLEEAAAVAHTVTQASDGDASCSAR